jgi:hypothetical protein
VQQRKELEPVLRVVLEVDRDHLCSNKEQHVVQF